MYWGIKVIGDWDNKGIKTYLWLLDWDCKPIKYNTWWEAETFASNFEELTPALLPNELV